MITLKDTFLVQQPPAAIFAFLADPANIARLPGSVENIGWLSPPPHGAGSRFQFDTRFLGIILRATVQVLVWEPPQRYGRRAVSGPLAATFVFTMDPDPAGTRLHIDGELIFSGPIRLLEPLLRPLIEKRSRLEIAAIQQLLNQKPA